MSKLLKKPKTTPRYGKIFWHLFYNCSRFKNKMNHIRKKSLLFSQKEVTVQLNKTLKQLFVAACVGLLSVICLFFLEYKIVQFITIASVVGVLFFTIHLFLLLKKNHSIQQKLEALQQNKF